MNFQRISFYLPFWTLVFALLGGTSLAQNDDGSREESDNARAQLAQQIDRNVVSGTRLMTAIRAQLNEFDEETRAAFSQIESSVRSAELRLRRSLKAAENASPENWSRARASLAANYETYSHAVAQAERLIRLGPEDERRERSTR